jgi:hypothetical protein
MALSSVVVSDLTFIPTYIPPINPTVRDPASLYISLRSISPAAEQQLLLLRSLFGLTFFLVQNCYLCAIAPHPSVRPSIRLEYQPIQSTRRLSSGGWEGDTSHRLTARARVSVGYHVGDRDEGRSPRNTRGVTVAADHCEQSTEAAPLTPHPRGSKALRQTYTEGTLTRDTRGCNEQCISPLDYGKVRKERGSSSWNLRGRVPRLARRVHD